MEGEKSPFLHSHHPNTLSRDGSLAGQMQTRIQLFNMYTFPGRNYKGLLQIVKLLA